jgi:hypothetical protein
VQRVPDPSQACPQWSDACGLVVLRWFTRSIRISRSWAPSVMMALPLRMPLSGYSILLWPLCQMPPASAGENQPVPDRTGGLLQGRMRAGTWLAWYELSVPAQDDIPERNVC